MNHKLQNEVADMLDVSPAHGPTMNDKFPLLFNYKVARLLWNMAIRIDELEGKLKEVDDGK